MNNSEGLKGPRNVLGHDAQLLKVFSIASKNMGRKRCEVEDILKYFQHFCVRYCLLQETTKALHVFSFS